MQPDEREKSRALDREIRRSRPSFSLQNQKVVQGWKQMYEFVKKNIRQESNESNVSLFVLLRQRNGQYEEMQTKETLEF